MTAAAAALRGKVGVGAETTAVRLKEREERLELLQARELRLQERERRLRSLGLADMKEEEREQCARVVGLRSGRGSRFERLWWQLGSREVQSRASAETVPM